MNSLSETRHCDCCKQDVTFHYGPTRHTMHLIATVCTCGLWLPMWMLLTWAPSWSSTKLCDKCNEPLWGK